MHTGDLANILKKAIGPPPEWDAMDTDQEGQFNAWKLWSSKTKLLRDVEAIWSIHQVEQDALRELEKEAKAR